MMKLVFFSNDDGVSAKFPNGYWYASTDDGKYDGDGPDPLTAVCSMVRQFERETANVE